MTDEVITLGALRRQLAAQLATASESPALDVRYLLGYVLACDRSALIAEEDRLISSRERKIIQELTNRRSRGEPVAYLMGEASFHAITLRVGEGVLVPRPETELLVDRAIDMIDGVSTPRIADLGTGSGAIALAIAAARPDAEIVATDLSPEALQYARDNGRSSPNVTFVECSWLDSVEGDFDLIVSNPPYIAADDPELDPAVRDYEPRRALIADDGGMAALDAVLDCADRLRSGGWMLVEHGHRQQASVGDLFNQRGLRAVRCRRDLACLPRATEGRAAPSLSRVGFG
ncbi:peptide chain release factor N(5)-glutamine methyltransferase [Gammaproteobacteria bacterium]|nr:peptide chain release factor N(5)-glutamine methyltransferase [Gammaproteobacteria bacterium]